MTTAGSVWWQPGHSGGRLETLGHRECRELLEGLRVGRIGYVTPSGPRIVPVNYTIVGERLLFRTSAHGEIARYGVGRTVAFEVDLADEFLQSGWSVLVVGRADEMTAASLRLLDLGQTPDPWPQGDRSIFVELPLTTLTGRRVHVP